MAEGNTEGILINEPKPAAAGSNTNPPISRDELNTRIENIKTPEDEQKIIDDARKAQLIDGKPNPETQPETNIFSFLNRSGDYIFYQDPEYGHSVFDKAGEIPGLGLGADLLNARLYYNEGNTDIASDYIESAITHVGDLISFIEPSPATLITATARGLLRIDAGNKLLQQTNRNSLKSKGKNSQKK